VKAAYLGSEAGEGGAELAAAEAVAAQTSTPR
jgi:hypothetical protein